MHLLYGTRFVNFQADLQELMGLHMNNQRHKQHKHACSTIKEKNNQDETRLNCGIGIDSSCVTIALCSIISISMSMYRKMSMPFYVQYTAGMHLSSSIYLLSAPSVRQAPGKCCFQHFPRCLSLASEFTCRLMFKINEDSSWVAFGNESQVTTSFIPRAIGSL